MYNILFYLLAAFGFAFMLSQSDGPFDLISRLRNWLMTNRYFGVFFYKLLSCYFCLGCWAGALVYFLQLQPFKFNNFILFSIASGTFSLILSEVLGYLDGEKTKNIK
jgi:uncharacterized membrane protein